MLNRRSFITLGGTAVLGIAGYSAVSILGARADEASVMTPQDAHAAAARGDILLVDIRRPDEWAETGVGEFAVPLDLRTDSFVADVAAARSNEAQPIAVICARGVRSARTTNRLVDAGLVPIIDVPEGMLGSRAGPGWLERGLPTVAFTL